DDRSFNSAAWEGVKRARKELPVIVRDAEPGDPTSIEPALRAFAQFGYDLIIGVGFAQGPIIEQVAADYPKTHFAIVDFVVDKPNVAGLVFKEHEGSFLVGMIAASTTKTNTLGFVGGIDAAWNNPGKGRELANSQIEQGADIVFQAAGNSGLGVFDAAEGYKRFAIGVDSNQNWIKPGFVLTSMVKRVDNAVFSVVKDLVEGKFK